MLDYTNNNILKYTLLLLLNLCFYFLVLFYPKNCADPLWIVFIAFEIFGQLVGKYRGPCSYISVLCLVLFNNTSISSLHTFL